MSRRGDKPDPAPGQRWRFGQEEGVITRILRGGGGGQGIAEFAGEIPATHVSTMLHFDAWTFLKSEAMIAPCRCVTLPGGAMLTDDCPMHSAAYAASATATEAPHAPLARHRPRALPRKAAS